MKRSGFFSEEQVTYALQAFTRPGIKVCGSGKPGNPSSYSGQPDKRPEHSRNIPGVVTKRLLSYYFSGGVV